MPTFTKIFLKSSEVINTVSCIQSKTGFNKVFKKHCSYQSIHNKQLQNGKSCLSNLLESTDCILNMLIEKNCSDVLYFDFKKAFDQVSHYRLLEKMKRIGLNQSIVNIIGDFLSGRSMKIKVGDTLSEARSVTSGVPQGSVLGPLLFLIFVNELPNLLISHCKLFADDLKLIVNPTNKDIVEQDLKTLEIWQSEWNLFFNPVKCKVMHIGKSNPKHIYPFLDGFLTATDSEKDLGITFDKGVDFSNHIKSIVSRTKGLISWLLRNILSREKEIMLRIYKFLIRPNVEYCT